MEYLYVEGHLYGDYFVESDGTEEQIEGIEETCPQCGDCDIVIDSFSTFEEAKKLIGKQHYNSDYKKEITEEAAKLFAK